MRSFVQSLIDRIKALVLTHIALEIEADLSTRDAERRADLLRQAEQYDEWGHGDVAEHLRQQERSNTSERPLESVLEAIHHVENKTNGKQAIPHNRLAHLRRKER